MKRFYEAFFWHFRLFLRSFSAISKDVVIILQFWQLHSKDLKNYIYLSQKSTSPIFFTRNKIKELAKTCNFFGITKPLCSANWEPAVYLFTYLNYQIGFSMLYTSQCEWIRKVKYNQHGVILPRLTYYSSPALWKAFWSFWKRRMKVIDLHLCLK